MKIDREINDDIAILTLRGEFDSFVVSNYLEEAESLAASGIRNIVLEMKHVKFIMSTAIGAVVKSRKMMKELGGDLVISQPSPFVQDVLDSLGLTRVIKVYDANDQAVKELGHDLAANLPTGNSVMMQFVEAERQKAVGKPVIGRILEVRQDGLRCQVAQAASFFPADAAVKAKFRLPLFRKAYYFEVAGAIDTAQANEDGAEVGLRFETMSDEDKKSIAQFLDDMQYLRNEVKQADQ